MFSYYSPILKNQQIDNSDQKGHLESLVQAFAQRGSVLGSDLHSWDLTQTLLEYFQGWTLWQRSQNCPHARNSRLIKRCSDCSRLPRRAVPLELHPKALAEDLLESGWSALLSTRDVGSANHSQLMTRDVAVQKWEQLHLSPPLEVQVN